ASPPGSAPPKLLTPPHPSARRDKLELEGPDLVARAQSIARRAHEGQPDKLGDDYIAHPQRVSERALFMAPAEDRFDCAAAGWLHDVVEDSEVTFEYLRRHGVPDRVLDAINCLNKRNDTSRADYFARIRDRKSTRLNSSHVSISYAGFCLKTKTQYPKQMHSDS